MSTQTVNLENANAQVIEQTPKTSAKQVLRDENGKLLPGHTANPNGRPRTALLSQALREMLEREGAAKFANTLGKLALKAKRDSDKIAAANMIADRTEGKPLQAMLVGHTIDEGSVRAIAELLGKMNIPPMLEADNE